MSQKIIHYQKMLIAVHQFSKMWNINEIICKLDPFKMKMFLVTQPPSALALLFFTSWVVFISALTTLLPWRVTHNSPCMFFFFFHVYVFTLEHPQRRIMPWSHSVLSTPFNVWGKCFWQCWSDLLWLCDAFAPLSVWVLRSALLKTSVLHKALHLLLCNT